MMRPRMIDTLDIDTANAWLAARSLPVLSKYTSPIGAIVDDYAILFAYPSLGRTVFFEDAITNPDADKEKRREALSLVIGFLIAEMQAEGFKRVLFSSAYDHITKMGATHGSAVKTIDSEGLI